ncbi:hypothetical protein FDP41_011373 [Naegleria fowleri]|uniref:Uncharacterized protein n=1 Tax=Naegleria fowleri TaxID=5763 RepID=A0A6A5BWH7_NAEFO|nr:uncharacterized protein FDP41_011373 [Naegleria fowleri]KAF0982443.1 hypothetical protein FDP41_011373 [Naegleria fowleri]
MGNKQQGKKMNPSSSSTPKTNNVFSQSGCDQQTADDDLVTLQTNGVVTNASGGYKFYHSKRHGEYCSRSVVLESIVPKEIPFGLSPLGSKLFFQNEHNLEFNEICVVEARKQNKLPKNSGIYKAALMENDLVVLTYGGTVHIFRPSENLWLDVDVENNFIFDMEVSEVNVFCITENGMYAFSTYNSWGQTGTGSTQSHQLSSNNVVTTQKVTTSEGVVFGSAYSGYGHTYFVTLPDRRLFAAGNTGLAQMGRTECTDRDFTIPVELNDFKGKSVTIIASGYAYCLLLLTDNSGHVFGSNDYMQLGYDAPAKIFSPLPLKIPSQAPIKGLSAGQWVSLALTEANEVFVTGKVASDIQYSGWTKIDLQAHGIPSNSLFDAYVIQNIVYLLSEDAFTVMGSRSVTHELSSFKFNVDMEYRKDVKYRVYPKSRNCTSNFFLFFYVDLDTTISHHFIFKFNEKDDLCDVLIVAKDSSLIDDDGDKSILDIEHKLASDLLKE